MENMGPVSGGWVPPSNLLLCCFSFGMVDTQHLGVARKADHFVGRQHVEGGFPTTLTEGGLQCPHLKRDCAIMPAEHRKVMQSKDPFLPNVPGNGGK